MDDLEIFILAQLKDGSGQSLDDRE